MANNTNDNFDPLYSPSLNSDGLRKFSDELISKKGKIFQFYIGDQSENIEFTDYSIPQNSCIYGKIAEVLDRFVKLNCYYIDPVTKKLRSENAIWLNTFQIRAMSELDGNGSLSDVFLHSKDASKIRKLILAENKGK